MGTSSDTSRTREVRPRRIALRGLLLAVAVSAITAASAAAGQGTAYAPPGFSWGGASSSNQSVAGVLGHREGYAWQTRGDVPVCVQARGFDSSGKGKWYGGGCGMSGFVLVPWGRILAVPKLRAHSLSFLGSVVTWSH